MENKTVATDQDEWDHRWLEKQPLIVEGEKLGYLNDHYGGYYSWNPVANPKDTVKQDHIRVYKRLLYETLVKQGNPKDVEMLLKKDDKHVDTVLKDFDIKVSSDRAYLFK